MSLATESLFKEYKSPPSLGRYTTCRTPTTTASLGDFVGLGFLLLALLALAKVAGKKGLELLVFQFLFSLDELGLVPARRVSEEQRSRRKESNREVESSHKAVSGCVPILRVSSSVSENQKEAHTTS